jgi:hypothetical protein
MAIHPVLLSGAKFGTPRSWAAAGHKPEAAHANRSEKEK